MSTTFIKSYLMAIFFIIFRFFFYFLDEERGMAKSIGIYSKFSCKSPKNGKENFTY